MTGVPERDWKYLRSIHDEMLEELSRRINDQLQRVLEDDWRRSTIVERCWMLQKHGLLKPEHIEKLDPKTPDWISPLR